MQLLVPTAAAVLIGAVGLTFTPTDVPVAVPQSASAAFDTGASAWNRSTASSPATTLAATPGVRGVTGGAPAETLKVSVSTGTTTMGSAEPALRGFALPLSWPLSPRPAVGRRFAPPLHQWSRGHRGVDLLATVGQPLLSPGDGMVAFSGRVAGRGVITIAHSGGLRTTYEPVEGPLTTGTMVRRGTRIGVVSATRGHCAPLTCVHWGAISGQTYLDPLSLMGLGRPILLPLR